MQDHVLRTDTYISTDVTERTGCPPPSGPPVPGVGGAGSAVGNTPSHSYGVQPFSPPLHSLSPSSPPSSVSIPAETPSNVSLRPERPAFGNVTYDDSYAKPMVGTRAWNDATAQLLRNTSKGTKPDVRHISDVNVWLTHVAFLSDTTQVHKYSLDGGRTTQYAIQRKLSLPGPTKTAARVELSVRVNSSSLTDAKSAAAFKIVQAVKRKFGKTLQIRVQMDNGTSSPQESIQGEMSQSSDVQQNTIITSDTTDEVASGETNDDGVSIASSEPMHTFGPLTDRWMPYSNFEVTTSLARGYLITFASLPSDLFTAAKCAPNIAPFEAFVYGNFDYEFRIVMNANKFQAGKLIATYRNDTYGAEFASQCIQGALSRPHVVLDLPARNEGVLKIPWKYHAPLVRVVQTSEGTTAVKAGENARFELYVLSPLVVSTDGLTTAYGQLFYRMKAAKFTGMSYRVSFQGDVPEENIVDKGIKKVLPLRTVSIIGGGLERMANQLGSSHNQDKPNDPCATVVVPRVRSNFPNVRGIDDATALRSFSTALTSYKYVKPPTDEPKSPKDLARIWGLTRTSNWSSSDVVGTRVFDVPIDPTSRQGGYISAPSPLEYAAGMFNFWNGPIEVRFDFVSTSFHQGSVLISIEFGRPVTSGTDVCSTGSTYTKLFHLGEQKSVTMMVPYIFDTAYRRTCGSVWRTLASLDDFPEAGTDQKSSFNLTLDVHTRVRMTVVNQLKPVQNVSSAIEVLMFWRAGSNFSMMGLKQCDFTDYLTVNSTNYIHNLPTAFTDLTTTGVGATLPYTAPTVGAVRVQMDKGEKEDTDPTAKLSAGKSSKGYQAVDDTLDFKDILRRPTLLIKDGTSRATGTLDGSNVVTGYWIPVCPPSRMWTNLSSGATNSPYDAGSIGVSPSTAIINLFRAWRGSTKYTIFFTPGDGCDRIYVTYVPHSGVTKLGEINYPTSITNTQRALVSFYDCGYATEIVMPAVNPSCSITVPYETELNWTPSWDDNGGANYTWRDKGYLNAGHVVIQPVGGSCTHTTFWAAGDDFSLAMFYGPSFVYNQAINWSLTELGTSNVTAATASAEFAIWAGRVGLTSTSRKKRATNQPPAGTQPAVCTATTAATTTTTTRPTTRENSFPDWLRNKGKSDLVRPYVLPRGGTVSEFRNALWRDNRAMSHRDFGDIADLYREWYAEHPSSQMDREDFSFRNLLTGVRQVASRISPRTVGAAAVACVPVVGPSVAMGMAVGGILDEVHSVGDVLKETTVSIKHTSDTLNTKLEELSTHVGAGVNHVHTMIQGVVDKVAGMLTSVASGASMIYNFLLDMFLAWYHRSWVVVGTAVVRIIGASLGNAAVMSVLQYGQQLGQAIQAYVNRGMVPAVQADVHPEEVIVGVLAGLAGTVVGAAIDPTSVSFTTRLFRRITHSSGMVYFVQTINFVKSIFVTFKDLLMKALGMVSPEASALQALSNKHAELEEFIRNAQEVTSEANASLLTLPAFRVKVWKTVMQAYQIQQLMSNLPNNAVSPIVSRLCTSTIKFGNEKFVDISSCPVRYEPFVICIEGSTNIGKSFMTESMIIELLNSIGYRAPTGGVAYYRQPGNQYWTGLRDQPAVVFDDWLQMNDTASVALQVSELFQLKTPALFSPNMAHLEEKKIHANPLVVVLLCNNAFPNISLANCPGAVFRRRDVVVRVAKKPRYKNVPISAIPAEVLQDFSHLSFCEYRDVSNRESTSRLWESHEDFLSSLKAKFMAYHTRETANVKQRMDRLMQMNRTVPPHLIDISDPFKIYYTCQMGDVAEQSGTDLWITSQRLEQDIQSVYDAMLTRVNDAPQLEIPEGDQAGVEASLQDAGIEAQFDLSSFNEAVATSALVWEKVFLYLSRAVRWCGESILTAFPTHLTTICSICQEDKPIRRLCRAEAAAYHANRDVRHATCDECWAGIQTVGPSICPVCRTHGVPVIIMREGELDMVTRMVVFTGNGVRVVADWIASIARHAHTVGEFQAIVDSINAILIFMRCVFNGVLPDPSVAIYVGTRALINANLVGSQADDGEAQASTSGTGLGPQARPIDHGALRREREARRQNISTSINQIRDMIQEMTHRREARAEPVPMDPPEDDYQDGLSYTTDDDDSSLGGAGSIDISHRGGLVLVVADPMQRGCREMDNPAQPYCYHGSLVASNPDIVYIRAAWELTYQGTRVSVRDTICGPDCYWAGADGYTRQSNWYNDFLRREAVNLVKYVHKWNTGTSTAVKDYFRGRVPVCIQPEWMANPVVRQEVQAMTSPSWWNTLTGAWADHGRLLQIIAAVTAACTALGAAYAMYQWMFPVAATAATSAAPTGGLAAMVQVQSPPKGSEIRHARTTEVRRGAPPSWRANAQAESHTQLIEAVEKYILRNAVTAELKVDGTTKLVFHGLGVCGHKVLIPRHYIETLVSERYEVWIGPVAYPDRRQRYAPSRKDFIEIVKNDLVVWTWPTSTESFKDIRKFFCTEEDLTHPVPSTATLYVLPGRLLTSVHAVEVQLAGAEGSVVTHGADDELFELLDVWVYNFSRPGACGSPLVRPNSTRPIIGIHVAGRGEGFEGEGYAIILTSEMLAGLVPDCPDRPDLPEDTLPASQCDVIFPPDVQVNYHGALPPGKVPYTPSKSKLERSSVYDCEGLSVEVRPAILTARDPAYTHAASPLILGACKYGRLSEDFTTEQLDRVTDFLSDMLSPVRATVTPAEKLTLEQAVVGLPFHEYYDPMDLNTSPGYPLMLEGTKKKDYVTIERDCDDNVTSVTISQKLLDLYSEAEAIRKTGERAVALWVDTPKDEKLPIKKVLKPGGTRLICNGPFEHALAMRRSFLHFSAAFMKNRHKLMHAVGINPTSMEWHMLATKLLKHIDRDKPHVVTMDYSNFGPAFNARVCQRVVQLIIAWTEQNVAGVDKNEMVSLMEEVVNSYHVCRNTIFTQNAGAPSGNQMTTVINSLVNIFYMAVAWDALCSPKCLQKGLAPFEEFKRCTCLVVYGDDLIMTVSNYSEEYNAITISRFFAKYKIVATGSQKDVGVTTPGVAFTEAEFLKRKFAWNGRRNIWMSQLREESLRATTQWVWKSPNRDLSTRVNCEVAVMNAHGLGPEGFEAFRATVNKALRRRRIDPLTLSWEDVDTMFYDHGVSTFI